MLPPSQPSVSTSTIWLGMRQDHKQDVDQLLRPPLQQCAGLRWGATCWGSEIGTLEVILLGLFCGKMSYSLRLLSSSSKFMLYYAMWCAWWLLWEVITIPACAVDRSGQKVQHVQLTNCIWRLGNNARKGLAHCCRCSCCPRQSCCPLCSHCNHCIQLHGLQIQ